MNKKIYLLIIILCLPFVIGETTPDQLGTYNGTAWNTPSVTGKVGSALNFTGIATSNVTFNTTRAAGPFNMSSGQSFSFAGWIYVNNTVEAVFNPIMSEGGFFFGILGTPSNTFRVNVFSNDGGAGTQGFGGLNNLSLNTWYHVVVSATWGTVGSRQVYINGANISTNQTCGSTLNPPINNTRPYSAGGPVTASNICGGFYRSGNYSGIIDELGYWNKTLNAGNVSSLYNSGNGKAYSSLTSGETTNIIAYWSMENTSASTYFTITASDQYDGAGLMTFFANVTHNGTTGSYGTSNGTINFNFTNNDGLINATIYNDTYFPKTYLSHDTVTNLATTIFQSQLTLGAFEVVTNNSVTTFTATTTLQGGSGTNPILYLRAGTYNVTFNKTGWFNKTQSFTVSALTNTTQNFTDVYQYLLNISASNAFNGTSATIFSINISSGLYTYTTTVSTTNGTVYIPWTSDTNFNLTLWNSSELSAATMLYNSSNFTAPAVVNITILSYTSNTILLRVYNENTQTLLNGTNATIYLRGTYVSYNYTTTAGSVNATLLQPDSYQIVVTVSGYSTRNYYLELTNNTALELNLYVLPVSYNTLLVTLIDESYNVLENYYISQTRKNLTGTNYFEVERCLTDINGQCLMATYLCLSNDSSCPFYNFVVYDENSEFLAQTGDTRGVTNTLPIQINIQQNRLFEILDAFGMDAFVSISSSGDVTYILNNEESSSTTASLIVMRRIGTSWATLFTNSTSSTTTITLTTNVNLSVGDEFRACGYFTAGDVTVTADCASYIQGISGDEDGSDSYVGWLLLIIVCMPLLFLSYNVLIPPVISGVLLYVFQISGILTLTQTTVGAIVVIVAIALWSMFS